MSNANHLADLIRLALARLPDEDVGVVLRDLATEAYQRGQRDRVPAGAFSDERPTRPVDLWDDETPQVEIRPSVLPTVRPGKG